jgi:hypothetical protein
LRITSACELASLPANTRRSAKIRRVHTRNDRGYPLHPVA